MQTIASVPSRQSIAPHLAEITPIRAVRDEDAAPYDGQSKAERTRPPFIMLDLTRMAEMAPKVGPSAFTVYAFLVQHYNRRTGECHPSQSRLAELSGLTDRTVREALARLEDAGYIARYERRDAAGHRDADGFTLNQTQPEESSARDAQPESLPEDLPEKSSGIYKDEPEETRRDLTPPLPPTTADARLDEPSERRMRAFIAAYPVNRRRYNARELAGLWATLSPREQEAAVAGVRAWSGDEEWTKERGRFVPGMVRFLTERGWESAPASPPSTGNRTVDLMRSMGI